MKTSVVWSNYKTQIQTVQATQKIQINYLPVFQYNLFSSASAHWGKVVRINRIAGKSRSFFQNWQTKKPEINQVTPYRMLSDCPETGTENMIRCFSDFQQISVPDKKSLKQVRKQNGNTLDKGFTILQSQAHSPGPAPQQTNINLDFTIQHGAQCLP